MAKRIIIIDDDETSRFLYRYHFRKISELQIVGEFETGEDALPKIPELRPEVIIVDYTLPGMSGIDFVQKLTQFPTVKILLVSGHEVNHFGSAPKNSPPFHIFQKDWSDQNIESIIACCK